MPAEPVTFSPVIRALAVWLSGRTSAGTIRSRFSSGAGVPQAVATRVGGPDTNTLAQLDCWAASDAAAEALAAELCTEVETLAQHRPTVEGVTLVGASVVGIRSFPDDAYARYICDIVLVAAS